MAHVYVTNGGTLSIGGGLRVWNNSTLEVDDSSNLVLPTLDVVGSQLVNNGHVSSTVTAGAGSYVKGSGSFDHLVVNGGATVSPGNSPGTMTDGATDWSTGGKYVWEINQTAADGGVAGGGALALHAGFIVEVHSLTVTDVEGMLENWNNTLEQKWLIATSSNGAFTSSAVNSLMLNVSAFTANNSLAGGISAGSWLERTSFGSSSRPFPSPARCS